MTSDHSTILEEAVGYAISLLGGTGIAGEEGWQEMLMDMPVSHAVALIGEEFRLAKQQDRGMDRYLVKHCVQVVINAATFPTENAPTKHDPDAGIISDDPDHRVFRYARSRGRPPGSPIDVGLAYTVGAVKERFELPLYSRPPNRPGKEAPRPSALKVVAEAQRRRKAGQPLSESGIKSLLTSSEFTREAFENGKAAGLAERVAKII